MCLSHSGNLRSLASSLNPEQRTGIYSTQCSMQVSMQASFTGLPENTPLVEAVEIDREAGAPRTAMQIATDKFRNRAPAQQAVEYPQPKKRDQFLEFSVMPCAPLPVTLLQLRELKRAVVVRCLQAALLL